MVSKLLLTIQLCPKTEFQSSERFGEDLSDNTWEYIFAIDLLCCHQKWVWTHDNIIRYGGCMHLGVGARAVTSRFEPCAPFSAGEPFTASVSIWVRGNKAAPEVLVSR